MKSPIFITGNPNKVKEVNDFCPVPIESKSLDLPEIQSLDPKEVLRDKARRAYENLQCPVLVEDVSLRFLALGELPGPFIKYFLRALGNDGLCDLLHGRDRSAEVQVSYGYFDGAEFRIFTNTQKGSVAEVPQGPEVFGWNPIFIPTGSQKTLAQMSRDELCTVSVRVKPLQELAHFLREDE